MKNNRENQGTLSWNSSGNPDDAAKMNLMQYTCNIYFCTCFIHSIIYLSYHQEWSLKILTEEALGVML